MIRVLAIVIGVCFSLFGANLGKLATGNINGTYYQMGKDISDLMLKYKQQLTPMTTEGSIQNLDILYGLTNQQDVMFAIVQSDVVKYYNYFMLKNFNSSTNDIIKVVLPLYEEEIHLVSKKGRQIELAKDKEYSVSCGKKESGSCVTAKYIEQAYGVKFKYNHDIDFDTAVSLMKEEKLDLTISIIGKPAKVFKAIEGMEFITLKDNMIMDGLYKRAQLSANDYNWVDKSVTTYAVPSVLVTNIPEGSKNINVVEAMVKVLVKNKAYLNQSGHPKWKQVDFDVTKPKNIHSSALSTIESLTAK